MTISKEDIRRYGRKYYVDMATELEKGETWTSKQKAESIWNELNKLDKEAQNGSF